MPTNNEDHEKTASKGTSAQSQPPKKTKRTQKRKSTAAGEVESFSNRKMFGERLEQLKPGESFRVVPKNLIRAFDMKRRGKHQVAEIDKFVTDRHAKLPDEWDKLDFYSPMEIRHKDTVVSRSGVEYRRPVSSFLNDETGPESVVSVSPTSPAERAISLMLENSYSQIPVASTHEPLKVVGTITWESVTKTLAQRRGEPLEKMTASEVMGDIGARVKSNEDMIKAIPTILQEGYVYAEGEDGEAVGLITLTDVVNKLIEIAGVYIRIEEPERHLKFLIGQKLEVDDFAANNERVNSAEDLMLGDISNIVNSSKLFPKLELAGVEQETFAALVDQMRTIRNKAMHFNTTDGNTLLEDAEAVTKSILALLRFGDPHIYGD